MENKMSHINEEGKANMVDVSSKQSQKRIARASGRIKLSPETIVQVRNNLVKKGDVLATARIAGIMGAKETSSLIPLCHPLQLSKISIDFEIHEEGIIAESEVVCVGQTGVEMEALTGVSVALLTIYDMCKAVDKDMIISEVKLIEKIKE